MVNVGYNADSGNYLFEIVDRYVAAGESVEEAKKKVLEMIEDNMNAAINEKLSVSFVIKEKENGFI